MSSGSGLTTTTTEVAGQPVAIAPSDDAALATSVEAPLIVLVLAADDPTLRAVVQAVVTGP